MSSVRIVTTPDPDTTQRVQLGVNTYSLRIVWSQRGECWHLHIADSVGAPLLAGLRMITMYPLIARYHHLALPPGELWFLDTRDQHGTPTLADMGDRYRLYYVTDGKW